MKGKTVLVTGATFGIGKETALGLARLGARTVIAGRDEGRARETVEWIKKESDNPDVEYLLADLSSVKATRELAAGFKARHQRLDVLVNNAGGMFTNRETSVDGFEKTWALNHLSYFVLTHDLLDLIKAAPQGRVVNVSSKLHLNAELDFDDLQGEKSFGLMKAYGRSKLANVLFTFALARRLKGTNATANCLHPGVVATGIMGRTTNGAIKMLTTVMRPFLMTPEKGAATSIFLASSPAVATVTGEYFDESKVVAPAKSSRDEALQERLWAVSLAQTGLK